MNKHIHRLIMASALAVGASLTAAAAPPDKGLEAAIADPGERRRS